MVGASFPPSLFPFTAVPGLVLFLFAMRMHEESENPAIPIVLHTMMAWGWAFSWVGSHVILRVSATSVAVLLALIMMATAASTVGFKRVGLPGLVIGHLTLEIVLTYGPVPMPWVSSGFTVGDTVAAPMVTLFGITGTSVVLWSIALFVAGRGRAPRVALAAVLAAWTFILAFLVPMAGDTGSPGRTRAPFTVRIVQPDLAPEDWADIHSTVRAHTLQRQSEGSPVNLIVWPETALPLGTVDRLAHPDSLYGSAEHPSFPLLTGGILTPADGSLGVLPWNAAILFQPGSEPLVYAKEKLVPFAEYVPGSRWFTALSVLSVDAGGVTGYAPGREPAYWTIGDRIVAPVICFESVFSAMARRHARAGADVLVVLAQTGWWTWSRAAHQHAAFSALTAKSVGLPILLSSVNGPSGVINAQGNSVGGIPHGIRSSEAFQLPPSSAGTPYTAMGEWPAWIIFGVLVFTSVRSRRIGRRSSDS
jgi:apolipoprotein N-acyltransferase